MTIEHPHRQEAKATPLDCQVLETFDSPAPARGEWDAFVQDCGSDIYLSYDWCRLWWEYYGGKRKLQIFVIRENEAMAALLPMFIDTVWLGPVRFRMAKLVGSDLPPSLCWPPVRPSRAEEIFRLVVEQLMGPGQCDAVAFAPLSGVCPLTDSILNSPQGSQSFSIARNIETEKHCLFHLPDSYEAYLESLNKKQRGNCRRERRLIEGDFEIRLDVVGDPDTADGEFSRFIEMHNAQWHSLNKRGHFGSWPQAERFNRALVQTEARMGRLRIVRLFANGQPVSYQYVFAFGNCYYWRLPARLMEKEWGRYSLGRVGLATLIETAIGEGIKRIEAGIGQYEYKVQLGAEEYSTRSIVLLRNRPGARLRYRLFRYEADLLNILYHKIWYSRLAMKLPLKKGTLWPIWIRSRT